MSDSTSEMKLPAYIEMLWIVKMKNFLITLWWWWPTRKVRTKWQKTCPCFKGTTQFDSPYGFMGSSLKSSDTNLFDGNIPSNKSSFNRGDERRHEAAVPPLAVSSTRPEKRESRVSTSSQEQKATNVRQIYDNGAATWPMSTVKSLRELTPSEDVIDIKPEPDDLIDEDLNFVQEKPLSQKKKLQ